MPSKFKCTPFMGQNVLLFRYIIAYDCKNVIPLYYKKSHFKEMFNRDGKIIKLSGGQKEEDKIDNKITINDAIK